MATIRIWVHDPQGNFTVQMDAEFDVMDDDEVGQHSMELLSYTVTNKEELADEDLSFIDFDYVDSNYQTYD